MMMISTKYILLLSQIHMLMFAVTGNDNCTTKDNCNDCYQTFGCIWCDQITSVGKCYNKEDYACPVNSIVEPESEYKVLDDNPFSDTMFFKPQTAKLSLGVGQKKTVRIQHKVPQDFTLDLYYLMDMSSDMVFENDHLADLSKALVDEMNILTKEFKIGFGSFIDKFTIPYFDTSRNPCNHCQGLKGYNYKNHLNLTKGTGDFVLKVNSSHVANSMDNPEGGFDAIMQAIACKDIIGWRDDALHLLIYVSNGFFHYAGDGLLSGIYKPNDMTCHLRDNEYPSDVYLELDYPSVGQINDISIQRDVSIIFAVDKLVFPVYDSVSKLIERSNTKQIDDLDNIVEIIKKQYQEMASTAELVVHQESVDAMQYFDIEIVGDCKKNHNNPSACINNDLNSIVDFDVTIKLKKCPKDQDNSTIDIKFKVTNLNKYMTIRIETLCKCPCMDRVSVNDRLCNNNGNSTCSSCSCNEGIWGPTCLCNMDNNDENECRKTDTSSLCSGRGECVCGTCKCRSDRYTGQFCDCDKFNCPRVNGKICNGQGDCNCESCDCYGGWTSSDCSCQNGTDKCLNPETNTMCSNNGDCTCNKCQCRNDESGNRYEGVYCDICDGCTGKCDNYLECALCLQNDPDDCNSKCNTIETIIVDSVTDLQGTNCTKHENKCSIRYSHVERENKLYVLKKAICNPVPAWVIVTSIISTVVGVVLVGLLIWRGYATYLDSMEHTAFKKSVDLLKSDQESETKNPMHKSAITVTNNPKFGETE